MTTSPPMPGFPWLGHPAPGRSRGFQPRGFSPAFTLLEIVIVLAITALVIGGAITTVVLSSAERVLRNASGEIELLAKRARTAAILHQVPYALEFHPGHIRLLPFSNTSSIERTTALGNEIGGTSASQPASQSESANNLLLDPEIVLTIRHWNAATFISPARTFIPVWRFDPDGLSEPLTIRLTLGDSYAQDTYHPLTATVSDSELEAR